MTRPHALMDSWFARIARAGALLLAVAFAFLVGLVVGILT